MYAVLAVLIGQGNNKSMSRAALLPTPGDPFLLRYWLDLYDRVWRSEIDQLYICINTPLPKYVVDYEISLCNQYGAKYLYFPDQIQHGDALNALLDICEEEYVMLIEDDGYIFRSGYVHDQFRKLEEDRFDVVGSKRGSCSRDILEWAQAKWGIAGFGHGDNGCNFWPNFFFTKKQILLDTDRNFNARTWERGELIEPLERIAIELTVGDTFVNTSLQLHARGYRMDYIPQYHGSAEDIDHYNDRYNIFDGQAPWTHVGSLSSGISGVLMDNNGRSLSRIEKDPPKAETVIPNYCNTEQEKGEWERRVQWFYRFWTTADNKIPYSMLAFWQLYGDAVNRVIDQYGLSRSKIAKRINIYATIGLWYGTTRYSYFLA